MAQKHGGASEGASERLMGEGRGLSGVERIRHNRVVGDVQFDLQASI